MSKTLQTRGSGRESAPFSVKRREATKTVGLSMCVAAITSLVTLLVGCVNPQERSQAGSRDHLLGWFKLPGRDEKNQVVSGNDTLIPVFRLDGTYYSVSRGFEIPLKECPEGLEWALTPSSMAGTKIGFNQASNGHYIVIADEQLSHNWQFYVSGQRQPVPRTEKPSGLLDAKARRPRTNDDFLGLYRPVWMPGLEIEIRTDGDRYFSTIQAARQPGGSNDHVDTRELTPLPEQLGFTGFDRKSSHTLLYNEALKRFELVKTRKETTPSLIRMPLARVPAPSSTARGDVPPAVVKIGIPSWH